MVHNVSKICLSKIIFLHFYTASNNLMYVSRSIGRVAMRTINAKHTAKSATYMRIQ